MDLDTYYKLISSEARARKYLLGKCFKNHQRFCPRCRCRKLYKLQEGRYRCSRCEYTFQDFSGRWINRGRLSAVQWLSLIKLFELEVSVRKMSLQLGIFYRTVYRVVSTIHTAILSHFKGASSLPGDVIILDEAYFEVRRKGNRGRSEACKVPLFCIQDWVGRVHVNVLTSILADTLLMLTIKNVRRDSVVYTDKFGSNDILMFCGYQHLKVDHQKYFSFDRVYIYGF